MIIRIIKDWIKSKNNNNFKTTFLIILFAIIIFMIPIITTVLPFTYIAL